MEAYKNSYYFLVISKNFRFNNKETNNIWGDKNEFTSLHYDA